jgi:hypothetical protein
MLHLKIKLIFKIYSIEILLDFQVVEGIPHQWWCVSCSLVPCSGLLRLTLSLLCYPQVLDWSLSDRRWGIWVGKDFLWLGCDLFFVWKEICCSKMFYIYKTKNTLFLIAKFVCGNPNESQIKWIAHVALTLHSLVQISCLTLRWLCKFWMFSGGFWSRFVSRACWKLAVFASLRFFLYSCILYFVCRHRIHIELTSMSRCSMFPWFHYVCINSRNTHFTLPEEENSRNPLYFYFDIGETSEEFCT